MLARRGARVVHGQVMHTSLLHDTEATIAATEAAIAGGVDVVVLTTGVGTRSWLAAAESAGLDAALLRSCRDAQVVARGPKARSAGIGVGLEVCWQAPTETGVELLAHVAEMGVAGRRVVVQRDGGEPLMADAIAALGADVVDVPIYRWNPVDDPTAAHRLIESTVAARLDAVTFTCAYAVETTFALAPDPDGLARALSGPVAAIAVGPVTASALRRHGARRVVEPVRARLGSMVQATIAELSGAHRSLRSDDHEVRLQGAALISGEDQVTMLTQRESELLAVLLDRSPAIVPKSDLVADGADEHAAEAAIGRLRSKLGPLAGGITAIPRRGYRCTLEAAAIAVP